MWHGRLLFTRSVTPTRGADLPFQPSVEQSGMFAALLNFRAPAELSSLGRRPCDAPPWGYALGICKGSEMNPWFTIARDAARMTLDAQSVVALRLAHFAQSTEFDWLEAQRMTAEKVEALAQVQLATAFSLMSGQRGPAIAKKAIGIYGKRVRDNRARLSRRKRRVKSSRR